MRLVNGKVMKTLSVLLILIFAIYSLAYAQQCYEATIMKPVPFLGNGGEIIILDDGTVWEEVSYQYLYLYEYYPTVVICPSSGKMILGDYVFKVVQIK